MCDLVVGIDPGKRVGLAVLTVEAKPFLVYHTSMEMGLTMAQEGAMLSVACTDILSRDHDLVNAFTGSISEEHELGELRWAAIEDQFISKDRRNGVVLAQRAGRWQMACETARLDYTMVMPRVWQSVLDQRVVRRCGTKTASIDFAKNVYEVKVNEHVADAIGIGTYAALKLFEKGIKNG